MTDYIACQIHVPDGRIFMVDFHYPQVPADGSFVPDWLKLQVFGSSESSFTWRLRSLRPTDQGPRFCLVADVMAGARRPFDPRQARLKKERLALEKLTAESDYVKATPIERVEGSEPERYRIVFSCRGIQSVDASQNPVYADLHEVTILCDEFFPSDVPKLRWETPIWHPNIQHTDPKGVCVNKAEWLGGMGLDDLVRLMFEMVQYKNYHADAESQPFPLDLEVAKWVREYAEPRGIVDKRRGIYVDDRPFTRPTVTGVGGAPIVSSSRIKLLAPKEPRIKLIPQARPEVTETAAQRIRIKKQE
jgi:ubiquitin-protein ligase